MSDIRSHTDFESCSVVAARRSVLSRAAVASFLTLLCACQPLSETLSTEEGQKPEAAWKPLRFVDGIERFERHVFLRQANLGAGAVWLDDRRILASVPPEPDRNEGHPELPLGGWVAIDTQTGSVEALPWRKTKEEFSQVYCYHQRSGRIIVKQRIQVAEKQWDMRWLMGTFGQPLETIYYLKDTSRNGDFPKAWQRLEIANCQPVERFVWQGRSKMANIDYLEPEHGWLVFENPYGPVGESRLYLVKPDGQQINIPITAGERELGTRKYLAFADGYFVVPRLNYSDPNHRWTSHYARLIHPDGRVERFPVPDPIMDRLTGHQGSGFHASATYTRRGVLWYVFPPTREKHSERLAGGYLQIGNELVRLGQDVGPVSPDGCKLLGTSELSRGQMLYPSSIGKLDYFVIDICREGQEWQARP